MAKHCASGIVSLAVVGIALVFASVASAQDPGKPSSVSQLDQVLAVVLREAGFTGQIESTLEARMGHRLDRQLADLGRLLWFDTITGLNDDNTCAGCHSPTNGFGDT